MEMNHLDSEALGDKPVAAPGSVKVTNKEIVTAPNTASRKSKGKGQGGENNDPDDTTGADDDSHSAQSNVDLTIVNDTANDGLHETEADFEGIDCSRVWTLGHALRAARLAITDKGLLHPVFYYIRAFFKAQKTHEKSHDVYAKNQFLRRIQSAIKTAQDRYLLTSDNDRGLPSKAEILATQFCCPAKDQPFNSILRGLLASMERLDLLQAGSTQGDRCPLHNAFELLFQKEIGPLKDRISAQERAVHNSSSREDADELRKRVNALIVEAETLKSSNQELVAAVKKLTSGLDNTVNRAEFNAYGAGAGENLASLI